jgi:hypothetical protein
VVELRWLSSGQLALLQAADALSAWFPSVHAQCLLQMREGKALPHKRCYLLKVLAVTDETCLLSNQQTTASPFQQAAALNSD